MSRRAVVWSTVVGLIIAALHISLSLAILGAKPEYLREALKDWTRKPIVYHRSEGVPLVEIVSFTYRCGTTVHRGDWGRIQGTIRIRLNGPSPNYPNPSTGDPQTVYDISSNAGYINNPCGWPNNIGPYPRELEVPLEGGVGSWTSPIHVRSYGLDEYGNQYTIDDYDTPFSIVVDVDTKPRIHSVAEIVSCNERTLRLRVVAENQPLSYTWSVPDQSLYGSGEFSGFPCTGEFTTGEIEFPASSIANPTVPDTVYITVTNANGTTSTEVLAIPLAAHIPEIDVEPLPWPVSIVAGEPATIKWSMDGSPVLADFDLNLYWKRGIWDTDELYSVEHDGSESLAVYHPYWDEDPPDPSETITMSGTKVVYPQETTTYWIERASNCTWHYQSFVVTVSPAPRTSGRATVASKYSILEDVRTGAGGTVAASYNIVEDYRTASSNTVASLYTIYAPVSTVVACAYSILEEVRGSSATIIASKYNVLATQSAWVASKYHILAADKLRVFARNLADNSISNLGELEANASPLTLVDVPLADGIYEVWVLRDGLFWVGARTGHASLVTIDSTETPTSLPYVLQITSAIEGDMTRIDWVSTPTSQFGLSWGIWYGASSPVSVTGSPAFLLPIKPDQTEYLTGRIQTASEYVAIAAIDQAGVRGPKTEAYLAWDSEPPNSPSNQTGSPW